MIFLILMFVYCEEFIFVKHVELISKRIEIQRKILDENLCKAVYDLGEINSIVNTVEKYIEEAINNCKEFDQKITFLKERFLKSKEVYESIIVNDFVFECDKDFFLESSIIFNCKELLVKELNIFCFREKYNQSRCNMVEKTLEKSIGYLGEKEEEVVLKKEMADLLNLTKQKTTSFIDNYMRISQLKDQFMNK